jgi:hypothetical protein
MEQAGKPNGAVILPENDRKDLRIAGADSEACVA